MADKAAPMPIVRAGATVPDGLFGLPVRLAGLAVLMLRASAIVVLMAPVVIAAALLLR